MQNLCHEADRATDQACSRLLDTVGDALYAIGGKWTLRIIIAIWHGHHRFNAIQRTIPGISARVLSNELKELELNDFIQRKVHSETTPVLVEYVLTDYCQTLEPVIRTMSNWGFHHRQKIRDSLRGG